MENQEPRPEEIANAISIVADSVLKLQAAGLIEPSNITKANLLLSTVLDKALEVATKCWNTNCDNDEESSTESSTIEEWAADLNFSEDLQSNLMLWQGMDYDGWKWALGSYYKIVGQPDTFKFLMDDAFKSDDEAGFLYNHGVNLITSLMSSK
jgi:hypothetical protein